MQQIKATNIENNQLRISGKGDGFEYAFDKNGIVFFLFNYCYRRDFGVCDLSLIYEAGGGIHWCAG
ncbi:hypothetical protein D3C78_1640930 [compost metagenome]